MLVRLFRDSFETPWGFRLQGGHDLNQELVVQRVFSNSPAEGELQRGDVILAINGRDASTLTHKQAQDSIKFGGGQVELLVSRPPSGASVRPLQPQSPTKAPPLPVHKTASIQIPIRRSSDHGPKIMPPPAFAGHQPKKITMNKLGGGVSNFGSNYGARAQQPGWSPQPSIYSQQYTPQPSMQQREDTAPQYQQQYQSPPQQQYQQYQQPAQQQQQYQPPPQQQYQQYQPPPRQQYQAPPQQQSPRSPQYQPYSLNQPQKTSAATFSPSTPTSQYISPGMSQPDYVRSEDPVNDEVDYEYVPVSQRRSVFKDKPEKQPQMNVNGAEDEYYYPNCPVWERRKMFMKDQPRVNRSGRRRTYGSPGGAGASQFGTDFSKGPTPAAVTVQQRPRPPPVVHVPVNAAPPPQDEPDTSSISKNWSGTLKSSGGPRPWEQEKKEYVMPSMLEQGQQQQSRGRPAPAVSPKPSRSPQPRKPAASPQKQIVVRSVPNDEAQQEQPPQDGAKAVHLQYNSPMGLYSNQNIEDTYNSQIGYPGQNTTTSTVSPQPKPGEYFDGSGMSHTMFAVDDSDEYLYQLLSQHKHLIGKTVEKNMAPKPNDYQAPVTQYVPIAQIHEQYQPEMDMVEGQPRYSKVEPPVRITPAEGLAQPPATPPKPITRPVVPPKPLQNMTPAGQENIQTERSRSREIQETVQVNESPPVLNKEPPDDRTEQSVLNDTSMNKVSTSTDENKDKVIDQPSDRGESGQNVDESVTLSLNNENSNNAEGKCVTVESDENIAADGNAADNKSLVDQIDSTKAESAPAVIDESSENSSTINDKLEQALTSDLNEPVVEDSGKIEQSTDMKVDESKESTSEVDSCIDSESLKEKGELDNTGVTGEINTEELGKNDETSSLKESHSVEEKEKSEPEPAASEEKDNASNAEEKAEKAAEEQQNVSEEKPDLEEVKTEDQTVAESNEVDSTSDAKEPTVEKTVEETDGNIESKEQTINETITLEGEIVESNEDTKDMVEQVVLEQDSVSTSNVDETVSGSQVEEEVVIVLQDDNQQEVTPKVEESVEENMANDGEKGEQQEASVGEKSETNDQSGKAEPVETEQSKTPAEETQDQQKETSAEETEAVVPEDEVVEDAAASKEVEDSDIDSAEVKKPKKKERLDLSQFKQEKKAPGKLNTKKWET